MFYQLLLPAIVIISLAVVIFIVARRALNVTPSDREKLNSLEKSDVLKKSSKDRFASIKSALLLITEKFLHLLRFSVGRINQTIIGWMRKMKEIRIERLRRIKGAKDKPAEANPENISVEKDSRDVILEEFFGTSKNTDKSEKKALIYTGVVEGETRVERPLIKEEVTVPDKKEEEKPKGLENILIDRIASDPRDVEAYERLGDFYTQKGNLQEAKECFKYVVKLSPSNSNARAKLRRIARILTKKI